MPGVIAIWWRHWSRRGYSVYALDLRGHGRSGGQRGHVEGWSDYRGDLRRFTDMLYAMGPPVFLLGHSMGGLAVLDYAVHFPDDPLCGLVVSSPLIDTPNVSPVIIRLLDVLARVAPRFSLDPGADSGTLSRDPAVAASYDADPLVHGRVTPRASVAMRGTQAFVLANLDAVQYPYLLVYGEADALVPTAMTAASFRQVGAADKTVHAYTGGYHELMNDTNKAEVLADILDWLDAHTPQ
jgi:alpha-beta hydrolase superfamily lysophospholipase